MEKNMSFAEYLDSIEPFTVGDMRKVLEGLPDDMQILLGAQEEGAYADWFNVSHTVGVPEVGVDDSDYSALTFFPVNNYDSRQF